MREKGGEGREEEGRMTNRNTPPSIPAYAPDSDRLTAKYFGLPLFSPKVRPAAAVCRSVVCRPAL